MTVFLGRKNVSTILHMCVCMCVCAHVCAQSHLTLCHPTTVAHQTPLSMGFPRQEYCGGLLFPSLGDLPNPGIESSSPCTTGRFFTTQPLGKPHLTCMVDIILLAQFAKSFANFIGTNWIVTLLPKLTRKWKKVLVTQSCWTLCDPKDGSPPGSSVHGIVQARILEWVTIPVSRGSSQPRDRTQVSCIVGRFFIFWAIAQTLMDNIFSKMKYKYKNFSRWRIWITLGLCLLVFKVLLSIIH